MNEDREWLEISGDTDCELCAGNKQGRNRYISREEKEKLRWRTWGGGLLVVVVVGCCSSQTIRKGRREGKKEKAVKVRGGKLECE